MRKLMRLVLVAGAMLLLPVRSFGEAVVVVGFNLESGGAQIATLARQIGGMQGVQLWGLSEVDPAWVTELERAAQDGEPGNFRSLVGTTGGDDRLLLLIDVITFQVHDMFELSDINIGGGVRAPLVAEVEHRPSGERFLFMANHLYRGRTDRRHEQARKLNAWARRQTLPVVAVGDYNFDWEVQGGDTQHDRGYDEMTAGDVFRWVRPAALLRTQCDPRFDSVLDFVFVAGRARSWPAEAEILFEEPAYCGHDVARRSDHRPMRAVFDLGRAAGPTPTPRRTPVPGTLEDRVRRLEERVDRIERELRP